MNVQSDGDRFATAKTNMFASEWSENFLHGSDTLWPLVDLSTQLLREGERIRAVNRVSWRKPMTSNMQIAVMRDVPAHDHNSAVDGEIRTNQGVFHFAGQLIDEPIQRAAVANPYVTRAICSCANCCNIQKDGTYQFRLKEPHTELDWEMALKRPAIQAASLAEIVTIAFTKMYIPGSDRHVLRLMGGLSNLPISANPETMFGFRETLDLRIDQRGMKEGRSGFQIVPFTFMFPNQVTASRAFAAVTDSLDLVDKTLGAK